MSVESLFWAQRRVVYRERSRAARVSIFIAALLLITEGAVLLSPDEETNGVSLHGLGVLLLGIVFLGLAFWARWRPFPASLAALMLYLTFHWADAFTDPVALSQGFLGKLLILSMLFRGVRDGYLSLEATGLPPSAPTFPEEC